MQTNFYQVKPMSTFLTLRDEVVITPEIQKIIDAKIASEVEGLKNKNTELLGTVKESKAALQQMQTIADKYKGLDGVDLSKVQSLLKNMDTDEDLQMLANGQREAVIAKHTARMQEAHAAELKAKDEAILAEKQRAKTYEGRVLDAQILSVATGLHKGAVEDALLVGRSIFSLDAKGNAVKLDAEGKPELGKDGKSPYGPAEWMESQKELKPHWFPVSTSGAGAPGTKPGAGNGKVISRSQFDAMDPVERSTYIKGGGTLKD